MHDRVRTEPVAEEKCSSFHRFVFEWNSTNVDRNLLLRKSYIRIFVESWNNHIFSGKNVSINVSGAVQLINENDYYSDIVSSHNQTSWEFMSAIEVGQGLQQFLEVDIKQQLGAAWEEGKAGSLIEIQLKFDVECGDVKHDKVPLKLTNPATLGVAEPKRKRKLALQPFLMIFADDVDIRLQIEKQSSLEFSGGEQVSRKKRNTHSGACRVQDFNVNFQTLGLFNILAPLTLNVKQCAGNCSLVNIQTSISVATNHARLLSSAALVYRLEGNPSAPDYPCCSPVRYSPVNLLSISGTGLGKIEINLYPDFTVEECGCR